MIEQTKSMKENAVIRWSVLFIVSLIMAANYYFYDALSPLKDQIQSQSWFFQSAIWISAVHLFLVQCISVHGCDWGYFAR